MENLAICENNQNNEIQKQLKKLEKLIKQTNEPAKPLTHGLQPTSKAEFWWFRPRWWVFSVLCVVFFIGWWIQWPLIIRDYQNEILKVCLSIIVPIFVIGIAIATLSHRLGESGQLTAEYIHEACRLPVFACQSFLTVLLAFSAFVFPWAVSNPQASPLTYIVLGSTIAIIPFFLFIVITLIRCANPKEAINAAISLSTKKLTRAFAYDAYRIIIQKFEQKQKSKASTVKRKFSDIEIEWEGHLQKIQNHFKNAIRARDLEHIDVWLQHVVKSINIVLKVCKESPVIYGRYNYDPSRLHKLLNLYVLALDELLILPKQPNIQFVESGTHLIVKSVHDEVNIIFETENFYCLRPLCWIVKQLYRQVKRSEYSQELNRQRAYFGNFYAYPQILFQKLPKDSKQETNNRFRQILHEGLSLWLLRAIDEEDHDLVKDLCEAGQKLVFEDSNVDLKQDKALLQHLVLTGKLVSDIFNENSKTISATNLQNLFYNGISDFTIRLEDICTLYKSKFSTIDTVLYQFVNLLGVEWEKTSFSPLRGSTGFSGRVTGSAYERLQKGFLYATALSLEDNLCPDPIPIDLTDLKIRLKELKENHTKLEVNSCSVMKTHFDYLDKWIDNCKQKKNEEDNKT